MRVVRAVGFGGPEVLVAGEAPPPQAEPGEVVVDVSAVEVLFLDTQLRSGWGREYFALEPPYVPGTGVAGTVTSVGQGVDPGQVGRAVVAATGDTGAYAERVAVPAGEASDVPHGVHPATALAALHDAPTALSRLERADIRAGETVLVTAAAGSLGAWLVPLARASGARVVAAARGEAKLKQARAFGADVVVDYSVRGWAGPMRDEAGEIAVVFDGAGGQIGGEAFGVTARGARFFSYGAASGDFARFTADDARRRGVTVVPITDRVSTEDRRRLTARALELIAEGTVRPVIGQSVSLERAAEAHFEIEARRVVGKTVLRV